VSLLRSSLVSIAAVVALFATTSAIGQRLSDRGRVNAPVASFVHLPAGWHEYRDTPDAAALNWRYRPNSYGWAPAMPRGGIAVSVYFPYPQGTQRYRPLRLVFPRRPTTLLKGTRDTREYRIFGRVRGFDVNVFVDIRDRHPSRRQLRAAQRVVSNVRFS
jgi:hypothetical protein